MLGPRDVVKGRGSTMRVIETLLSVTGFESGGRQPLAKKSV